VYNKNVEEDKKISPFFSVFNTVRKLREQRNGMLTSHVQYKFIYDFTIEWIRKNWEI
jgi:protein tyrosine phosphatase